MPRTRVSRPVTIQRSLPSLIFFCSRKKREVRRLPVAGHESIQIVPIPGLLLRAENLFHLGLRTCRLCNQQSWKAKKNST